MGGLIVGFLVGVRLVSRKVWVPLDVLVELWVNDMWAEIVELFRDAGCDVGVDDIYEAITCGSFELRRRK